MNFRKMISPLFSAVFLLSVISCPTLKADAESEFTVSLDSKEVLAGETFDINLNFSNVPDFGVSGIDFSVKYDSSVISVNSVTEGSVSKTGASQNGDLADSSLTYNINNGTSTIDFIWLTGLGSDYYIKDDGVFVTLNVTVAENASGKTNLEIIPVSRNDISGSNNVIYATVGDEAELVKPSVSNGVITISDKSSETSSTTQTPVINANLGDANCDGIIDIRDITVINQSIIKAMTLSEQGKINSDVVADGKVDVSDLGQLKKFVLGLIESF